MCSDYVRGYRELFWSCRLAPIDYAGNTSQALLWAFEIRFLHLRDSFTLQTQSDPILGLGFLLPMFSQIPGPTVLRRRVTVWVPAVANVSNHEGLGPIESGIRRSDLRPSRPLNA